MFASARLEHIGNDRSFEITRDLLIKLIVTPRMEIKFED